ncbi:MAG: MBL fold metallo-hydrolase, partial [Candidatus Odinarchaeota archaeon]
PLKDMKNKFLMAQPSEIDHVIKNNENKLVFEEIELNIVPLPGHALNQVGLEVNNVLFCADSVFSEEILEKHGIHFNVDIDRTKETLRLLKESRYDFYIPSHAKPGTKITDLVKNNLSVINRVERTLLEILQAEKTTEQALKEICDDFMISLNNPQQYYLANTTVMAYLSSLHTRDKLHIKVKANRLSWQTVEN